MTELNKSEALFLRTLRCAVHGESASFDAPLTGEEWQELRLLALKQRAVPLVAEALHPGTALSALPGEWDSFHAFARKRTAFQAARTGDFLLLLRDLEARGLRPVVIKGIVCRSLYPEPEQRLSNDEDLFVASEELPAYHAALLACGLKLKKSDVQPEGADEVTYVDPERDLYLELHARLFPGDTPAFAEWNRAFDTALSRAVSLEVHGQSLLTLQPEDHLLYLLCHAGKHLLFSGIGIRQICDICLFARHYDARIDWPRFRARCASLGLETLTAAVFRIGQRHLGIPAPAAFSDLTPDETPLLKDCLAGGLYGSVEPDRIHSARLTLTAAASGEKSGLSRGVLKSVFPPLDYMKGRFDYLKKRPWLLPAAWTQRLWRYAAEEKGKPSRSLQIGRERIRMLRQYGLL